MATRIRTVDFGTPAYHAVPFARLGLLVPIKATEKSLTNLLLGARFRTETVQPNRYRHALYRILLRNEKNDGRCTLNSQQSNYRHKMIAALFL